MTNGSATRFARWLAAAGLSALLIAGAAPARTPAAQAPPENAAARPPTAHLSARDIFLRAAPAVVKIYGAGVGRQQGYGTGVIVSPDGLIVTCQSVMLAARSIRIVTHDGRPFDASLVRQDEARKLALLQIRATALPHLMPHGSDHLRPGDTVLALGNWFKIAAGEEAVSLTRGVFSFKASVQARRLAQDYDYPGPVLVYDAITSNPGAAGGALLDAAGNLVGLVGTVVESAATNTRVNHAIPGEDLAAFLRNDERRSPGRTGSPREPAATDSSTGDSAAATGDSPDSSKPAEPYLGLTLSRLGYRQSWAFVERVRPGTPAAAAGILPDDLIVAIDGRRVADASDYDRLVSGLVSGQQVPITVKRGDKILTLDVKVGARP